MKLINTVVVRVFAKEDEDYDAIKSAFLQLFPFDLKEEKIAVEEKSAEGFHDKKIKVISVMIVKDRHTKAVINNVKEKLGREVQTLIEQSESRLDDNLDFFIRLDKDRLLSGKYVLTDGGNCVHIKINLAAFPKKREKGLQLVKELFK